MNEALLTELEAQLGMADPESLRFTVATDDSVEMAMGQWEALYSLEGDDEVGFILQNIIAAIDLLNVKYGPSYDLTDLDESSIAGLSISLERAASAVMYGMTGELYQMFSNNPGVFQAMFGPRIGRKVFVHGQKEAAQYEQVSEWREQDLTQFRGFIEDTVNDIGKMQREFATSLGMQDEVINEVLHDFHLDRVMGDAIDLEQISTQINVTISEATRERINASKDHLRSGLYFSKEQLGRIEDSEKRHKLQAAIDAAKTKDRLKATRHRELAEKQRQQQEDEN